MQIKDLPSTFTAKSTDYLVKETTAPTMPTTPVTLEAIQLVAAQMRGQ